MEPAQIGREEVVAILRKAGSGCRRQISAYLIGGGAMALRGEKDATRDLDLVLESQDDADDLKRAFEGIGFIVNARRPDECQALVDAVILSKPAGLRADIFVGKVCDKLCFSEGMRSRATPVDRLGKLTLLMCSREDIFLLKSVTERARDLDDMMSLFRSGLERDVILEECGLQTRLAGFRESPVWEAFLLVKVEEMEERYGVNIPWKRTLRSRAEVRIGAHQLLKEIDRGMTSVDELSERMDETPTFARKCLRHLEEIGEIAIEGNARARLVTREK
jgi:hypothetical protein